MPLSTQVYKNIIKETNIKKYGVEHHSQNPIISEKMMKSSYKNKIYIFPSDNEIHVQGYEHFALDKLIYDEKLDESQIVTDRKSVPEIWYFDSHGKRRRHFVDIYIPTQNRCIEVKSLWTLQSKNNYLEKKKYAIDDGFIYDIWVFNNKGEFIKSI